MGRAKKNRENDTGWLMQIRWCPGDEECREKANIRGADVISVFYASFQFRPWTRLKLAQRFSSLRCTPLYSHFVLSIFSLMAQNPLQHSLAVRWNSHGPWVVIDACIHGAQ
jgi:hypothetical protein